VSTEALRKRIEEHIRALDLIPRGDAVTCLVSGGADSTCLWHALGALGYAVSAVHVDHGLRAAESDEDARFCRETLGARVIRVGGSEPVETREAQLRDIRYAVTAGLGLRATGHTRSDQAETVLYHLVSRGHAKGIEPKREDGVVRPLLPVTREEARAYCEREGLPFRDDSSNPDTKRGLIRERILPLLRELHPAAEENLLRLLDPRETLSPELAELLAAPVGSKRIDLGGGVQAVREYDRLWLEHGPKPLRGRVRWGEWTIESRLPNLHVRAWRAGDRLAGRRKKVQDVFVDAKVPRSDREAWPLVVRGDEVVAIPGLVDAPGVKAERA
jgi:tRNA(Ile)-lysidine synthase